jgi:hypothetical protein
MLDLRIALVCVSDLCVCVGVFVCLGVWRGLFGAKCPLCVI